MANGPFKMKGSPMARNFGAPFKQDNDGTKPLTDEDKANRAEYGATDAATIASVKEKRKNNPYRQYHKKKDEEEQVELDKQARIKKLSKIKFPHQK
jgi:hypothetical protein